MSLPTHVSPPVSTVELSSSSALHCGALTRKLVLGELSFIRTGEVFRAVRFYTFAPDSNSVNRETIEHTSTTRGLQFFLTAAAALVDGIP